MSSSRRRTESSGDGARAGAGRVAGRPRSRWGGWRRLVAGGGLVWLSVSASAAGQPPPRDLQPGRKLSPEELRAAASAVRAGRRLTPRQWPGGARVAVCLTFSLTNAANQLARGDSAVVALTYGEFGATTGLPRVLEVLDRHQVPATFFVPAVAALVDPGMIPEIVKRGRHEIALMGWSDENPLALAGPADEERLLVKAVDVLTRLAGRRPVGARGPSGQLSPHTLGILKRLGFLYDSTLAAMDEPYELVLRGEPSGLVELPMNPLLDDLPTLTAPRTGPAALPSPELVFETFKDDFEVAYEEGTLFLLTLHPHLVGMRSRIGYLDELLRDIQRKPGVWFATAGEIARYVLSPPRP
jgi:peptidoglycan/xylan/chitin deacetylase (PgdA/CDA1 family)